MKTILCVGCLLAGLSAEGRLVMAQAVQKAKPIATVVLSAPDGPVKPGALVRLQMLLTNISEEEINVEFSDGYEIDVRDEKGDLAPETDQGAFLNHRLNPGGTPKGHPSPTANRSMMYKKLKPGETYRWLQDVENRYRPLSPGKYTVQAEIGAYLMSVGRMVPVRSNAVTMTVVP